MATINEQLAQRARDLAEHLEALPIPHERVSVGASLRLDALEIAVHGCGVSGLQQVLSEVESAEPTMDEYGNPKWATLDAPGLEVSWFL